MIVSVMGLVLAGCSGGDAAKDEKKADTAGGEAKKPAEEGK